MSYTQEQADRWDKLTLGDVTYNFRQARKRLHYYRNEKDYGFDKDERRSPEDIERSNFERNQDIRSAENELKSLREYLRVRQRATFPRLESTAETTEPVSSRKLLRIPTGSGTITFTGEGRKNLLIGGM
jgi:outer membrane protein TolC